MADITLVYAEVEDAINQMQTTTTQMEQDINTLVNDLQQVAETFVGAAANAFNDLSRNREAYNTELNNDLAQGRAALTQMVQEMSDGDNRAASLFHS
jgi:WXG100 family type VII secretion target